MTNKSDLISMLISHSHGATILTSLVYNLKPNTSTITMANTICYFSLF